ncbi:hypothetical protein OF83DRAFT_1082174 [Amylostereum chailletii]|nr:hypothetical protein OF83DRAFT_1082174 [Amylostereum chailletii]
MTSDDPGAGASHEPQPLPPDHDTMNAKEPESPPDDGTLVVDHPHAHNVHRHGGKVQDDVWNADEPPTLHFVFRWPRPLLYIAFLVLCNVAFPCIIFYPLKDLTHLQFRDVVGISSSALGISSCFDAPLRLWKLTKHRREFGPLHDDTWWHLDFFMWFYTYGTLIFAIPLIVGPVVPLFNMFLMATPMLVLPWGVILAWSIIVPMRYPFWLSSDPPATAWRAPPSKTDLPPSESRGEDDHWPLQPTVDGGVNKPAVFYILEDVVAVDFGYKREWRHAVRRRYAASPMFRRHMKIQTAYWAAHTVLHFAVSAAVTWGATFNFAFGWVLGQFFIWALVAGLGSYALARWQLRAEHAAWKVDRARDVEDGRRRGKVRTGGARGEQMEVVGKRRWQKEGEARGEDEKGVAMSGAAQRVPA